MRASPPVALEARSFVAWRAGVGLAALAASAVLAAWLARGASLIAGGVLIGVVVVCAATLWRQRPFELAWDGHGWSIADGGGATSGRLEVVIDLGPWMLLRWHAQGPARSRWLPVQAGEGGSRWRAFRAAAYARAAGSATPTVDRGRDG